MFQELIDDLTNIEDDNNFKIKDVWLYLKNIINQIRISHEKLFIENNRYKMICIIYIIYEKLCLDK